MQSTVTRAYGLLQALDGNQSFKITCKLMIRGREGGKDSEGGGRERGEGFTIITWLTMAIILP